MRPALLAAALSGLLFASAVQAQDYAGMQPVDRIAAVVNEDVILRSELDRAVGNIRAQYAGREDQLPPADVLERQVLERLVLMRLQIARATEAGITAGEEDIQAAVQGIAEQNGMTVDQLRERLQAVRPLAVDEQEEAVQLGEMLVEAGGERVVEGADAGLGPLAGELLVCAGLSGEVCHELILMQDTT